MIDAPIVAPIAVVLMELLHQELVYHFDDLDTKRCE